MIRIIRIENHRLLTEAANRPHMPAALEEWPEGKPKLDSEESALTPSALDFSQYGLGVWNASLKVFTTLLLISNIMPILKPKVALMDQYIKGITSI
jgi:hypothetical protein